MTRARPLSFSPVIGLRLWGHGAAPLLSRGEIFLHLEHFRALQVAELGRPAIDAAGDQRQRAHEMGVRSRWIICVERSAALSPSFLADVFLHPRIEMRVGADGAGKFSHRDLVARLDQPLLGAAELVVHQRELEAVGDRLGVDAVRAAHHRREFVFLRADGDRLAQFLQVGEEQVRAGDELERHRRIEQVGRGEPAMDEPARAADMGRHFLEKGDDIVVGPFLVLTHLLDVETRPWRE